ncbi:MAG TPA: hypothetical protein VG298_16470, partial [Acidimicrobiales bacterium]|nr:hypothetical protein [Acidimicrobiales bacterium]
MALVAGSIGLVGVAGAGAASAPVTALHKAFGAATIPVGGTTTLTFTLDNGGVSTLSAIAFTDDLPSGLQFDQGAGVTTNNCNGATVSESITDFDFSAGAVDPGVPCVVTTTVTGITAGVQNNMTSPVSTSAGTLTAATASITVLAPPTIAKSFGVPAIGVGQTTTLSITLTNPNTDPLTGIDVVDNLPAGIDEATPISLTGTCSTGTIVASNSPGKVQATGVSLPASSSCTFTTNVIGVTPGSYTNTTGNVTSVEGGTGGTASAPIAVLGPPTIAKAFAAPSIASGGTTALTFTITNPNATTALTGVAVTDSLPAGLVVATPNGLSGVCGGTVTATAGSGFVSLTGGSIPAGGNCVFSVNVTSTTPANYTNTTGTVSSTNGGTGNTATAALNVGGGPGGGAALPPVITKAFGTSPISVGDSTSLTFTITNPAGNSISLTGVSFTDSLPSGLVVANPANLTSTCPGTAFAFMSTVSLTGIALLPLGAGTSCTVALNVTGTTAGTKNNVTSPVTSVEAGPGNSASATLVVGGTLGGGAVNPPTIAKLFGAGTIAEGESTSLTFTITNAPTNIIPLTGVSMTDHLPAGLEVATPSAETGSCGGVVTAPAGSTTVTLSGGTLTVGGSCTFSLNVTATTLGVKDNTTDPVTSTESGPGGTASASLSVSNNIGGGGGGCGSGRSSGTSSTPGSSASAVNDSTRATALNGTGTVTVGEYAGDPVGPAQNFAPTCFFDVALSTDSTFTSVTITNCATGGGNSLQWWNPAADGGAGAWQPVTGDPGPTLTPGTPPCLSVTLDGTTSPTPAQLSGTVFASAIAAPAPGPSAAGGPGYWLAASDGGVFSYGGAAFHGSAGGIHLNKPIVGLTATPDDGGYWLVASDGGVFSYGDAGFHGSTGSLHLNKPIVGMTPTPDGGGYWLVASDGGVFSFGDAAFHGSAASLHLTGSIVGITSTPDGGGYWLASSDGGVFAYGDASFHGSEGGHHLNAPIVGLAATPDGGGYWLVASDGGVFGFGDA